MRSLPFDRPPLQRDPHAPSPAGRPWQHESRPRSLTSIQSRFEIRPRSRSPSPLRSRSRSRLPDHHRSYSRPPSRSRSRSRSPERFTSQRHDPSAPTTRSAVRMRPRSPSPVRPQGRYRSRSRSGSGSRSPVPSRIRLPQTTHVPSRTRFPSRSRSQTRFPSRSPSPVRYHSRPRFRSRSPVGQQRPLMRRRSPLPRRSRSPRPRQCPPGARNTAMNIRVKLEENRNGNQLPALNRTLYDNQYKARKEQQDHRPNWRAGAPLRQIGKQMHSAHQQDCLWRRKGRRRCNMQQKKVGPFGGCGNDAYKGCRMEAPTCCWLCYCDEVHEWRMSYRKWLEWQGTRRRRMRRSGAPVGLFNGRRLPRLENRGRRGYAREPARRDGGPVPSGGRYTEMGLRGRVNAPVNKRSVTDGNVEHGRFLQGDANVKNETATPCRTRGTGVREEAAGPR